MAGFKELLAVEWDNNAVATFKLNFPDVTVYHGDIGKLTSQECMRLAGIKAGELDILDGSPPCQGFSIMGNRKHGDPRNSLFEEYARLLGDLQPRCFVMENVTGIVKGHMKQTYLGLVKTLRNCGYKVRGQILNAMYYNVPQERKRVIVVGVRDDLGIEPSHPKPKSKPISVESVCPEERGKKYVTFRNRGGGRLNCWSGSDRPLPTITKKAVDYYGNKSSRSIVPLSVVIPCSSFPKKFKWSGTTSEIISRIGNSVPPQLMKSIATHIKDNILAKCA